MMIIFLLTIIVVLLLDILIVLYGIKDKLGILLNKE